MTRDEIRVIARATADNMEEAGEVGARLSVEKVFVAESSRQLADPVAIGGLIVSIATLAWTIFKDSREMKSRQRKPDQLRDELVRNIQEEVGKQPNLSGETRNRLINAVVTTIMTEHARM